MAGFNTDYSLVTSDVVVLINSMLNPEIQQYGPDGSRS